MSTPVPKTHKCIAIWYKTSVANCSFHSWSMKTRTHSCMKAATLCNTYTAPTALHEVSKHISHDRRSSRGRVADPPTGMLETTMLTGWMPTVLRIGRGLNRYQKRRDAEGSLKLLELYNYENNQFSRLVRPTPIIHSHAARAPPHR